MKKTTNKFEQLLQAGFRSDEKVDEALITKTKIALHYQSEKRGLFMKKPLGLVAAATLALLLTGVTVYAAFNLLTPSEVAEVFEQETLALAFEAVDANNINETKTSGDYIFTLSSIVTGSDLAQTALYNEGEISLDRSYIVLAIQKADGTSMEDSHHNFLPTPFIRGFAPWRLNIASLGLDAGGGFISVTIDGVLYKLIETGNIEIFANHGVYFAVTGGSFSNFAFDDETGNITIIESDVPSVLFELTLDSNLADEARVSEILEFMGLLNATFEEEKENEEEDSSECIPPMFEVSGSATTLDEFGLEVTIDFADAQTKQMNRQELIDFFEARIEVYIENGEHANIIQGARGDLTRHLHFMDTYDIAYATVSYGEGFTSVTFMNSSNCD